MKRFMRIVIGILLAGSFVSTTWAAAAAESFVVRAIFPSTVSYAVATAPAFVIELPVPFPEQFSIGSGRTMLATDVASVQLYVYGVDRKPSAVIEGKLVDNHGKSSMIFWLRGRSYHDQEWAGHSSGSRCWFRGAARPRCPSRRFFRESRRNPSWILRNPVCIADETRHELLWE